MRKEKRGGQILEIGTLHRSQKFKSAVSGNVLPAGAHYSL
jgi:hypothetical protein